MNKKEAEDKLFSQFMIDLDLYDDMCEGIVKAYPTKQSPPVEDELVKGLRRF
jgi:hypothetical protein